jgi:hypothetical protein
MQRLARDALAYVLEEALRVGAQEPMMSVIVEILRWIDIR